MHVGKHRKWKKLTIKSQTWQLSATTGARLSHWHWSTRHHWGIQREPRRLPNKREKTSKMPALRFHNINTPTVSISLHVCSTAATMCTSIFSMNMSSGMTYCLIVKAWWPTGSALCTTNAKVLPNSKPSHSQYNCNCNLNNQLDISFTNQCQLGPN